MHRAYQTEATMLNGFTFGLKARTNNRLANIPIRDLQPQLVYLDAH